MKMNEAGTCFDLAPDYHVELPPGDHLLVVAGGKEPFDFDHPNLSARVPRIWEFKHYHPQRGKWWTQKAGISLYFVIPKNEIELLPEKGYSYVPVKIGGRNFDFNVSGGTLKGWTDFIRSQVHTQVGLPNSALKALASVALPPKEVIDLGLGFNVTMLSEADQQNYQALAVKPGVQQANIKRLVLGRNFSWQDKKGPFQVVGRSARHRKFTVEDSGWHCRITYSQIDWLQTALLNEIVIPNPVAMNRVGAVEQEVQN